MIPTSNHQSRDGARVRLICLHTTEGAPDVTSLGRFFQTGTDQASYHAAFDDNRCETYVDYSRAAWAIRSGNKISDNAAFCGRAAWDRAEWLRHPRMLELSAQWIAARCTARRVPIRRLSLPEVRAALADTSHPGGVIMHRDYTLATRDGSHVDCGDGLPWDIVLARAQALAHPKKTSRGLDMPAGDWATTPTPTLHTLTYPIGDKVTNHTTRGWISVTASEDGAISVEVFGDRAGRKLAGWTDRLTKRHRWWKQLPNGTETVEVTVSTVKPTSAGWCLELEPRTP